MAIDPDFLANLQPGDEIPLHEVPGWGTDGFDEEMLKKILKDALDEVVR
jgi:hypothetical protein